MSRQARSKALSHYYHVINRGAAKAPLFARPRDYREFLAILREGLSRQPTPVLA